MFESILLHIADAETILLKYIILYARYNRPSFFKDKNTTLYDHHLLREKKIYSKNQPEQPPPEIWNFS